ncbi:MAG: hypothetical protein CMN22_04465 [Rubrivirga sp.]|jgi:hypothetical protein|nr:hypothetical protein [Rubrivirga sp.]
MAAAAGGGPEGSPPASKVWVEIKVTQRPGRSCELLESEMVRSRTKKLPKVQARKIAKKNIGKLLGFELHQASAFQHP